MLSNTSYPNHTIYMLGEPDLTGPRIVAIIIGIVGVVFNLLTLLALRRVRRNQRPGNLRLIYSLIGSDLLTSIAFLMDDVYSLQCRQPPWCFLAIVSDLKHVGHVASLLNLSFIAIDLYIAIAMSLRYNQTVTPKRMSLAVLTVWLVAFIGGFSTFFGFNVDNRMCDMTLARNDYCYHILNCNIYYSGLFTLFIVVFALGVMTFVYAKILRKVLKLTSENGGISESNMRGFVTTCVILVTFYVCFLPYFIMEIHGWILPLFVKTAAHFNFLIYKQPKIQAWLAILVMINSVVDPLTYATRLREVQVGFRRLFCAKKNSKFTRSHSCRDDESTVAARLGNGRVGFRNHSIIQNSAQDQLVCSGTHHYTEISARRKERNGAIREESRTPSPTVVLLNEDDSRHNVIDIKLATPV